MSNYEELYNAIKTNDISLVKSLISTSSIDVNAPLGVGQSSSTALIQAARRGLGEMVTVLLSAGARINSVDASQGTAAHVAAMRGDETVLGLLMAHSEKPNLNMQDFAKRTPLDLALVYGQVSVVLRLLAAGVALPDTLAGLCGAAGMSLDIIHALIARGVVVRDLRYERQRTALHAASSIASKPDLAVLHTLVHECGIDVHARDKLSLTACHLAASYGNSVQLGWLMEAGSELEAVARGNMTPLMLACAGNHVRCTTILLAYGADPETPFTGVDSVLHPTQIEPRVSVIHLLIAAGSTRLEALTKRGFVLVPETLAKARHCIVQMRFECVRTRALQVCIGLQSLELDALSLCEILVHACGRMAPMVAFHQWWAVATTVKHHHK